MDIETSAEPSVEKKSLRIFLCAELKRRVDKNSAYSLRAFAKNLQIEPSLLSKILSGKHNLSHAMLLRLCEKLHLDANSFS